MEGVVRVAFCLLLALQGAQAAADYCSLCDEPGSHTMCVYPVAGPAPNCTNYRPAPLSAREKRAIVRTHNLVRRRVATGRAWARASGFGPQPPAADMRQLHWDEELAEVAQRWADRCLSFYTHGPHDACRDLPRFPVGQNIVSTAYSKPAASDVRARTLDWYGELAFFDPAVVRRFVPNPDPDPAKQIGHYSQMVWGWTYAIGCARVVFEEQFPEEAAPWVVERLVCNYAPSGNYLGHPVYTAGAPCSRCPRGTVCSERYPGLCAAPAPAAAAASNDSSGTGYGDALQTLLQPASEAATEYASDEDVVLDGVRAFENGSRPSETYKAPFELEESPDVQGAESRDTSEAPTAGADGANVNDDGDGGEGSDSNQSGEDAEGVDDREDGDDSKANESSNDGEGNEGEKDRDGRTNDGDSASKWERLLPPGARPANDRGQPTDHFYYTYNFGTDSSL